MKRKWDDADQCIAGIVVIIGLVIVYTIAIYVF